MYQAIYSDKKTSTIHLWDDTRGYINFEYKPCAYRKKKGGSYTSIYGDELEKITRFNPRDPSLFQSDVPWDTDVLINAYGDSDDVSINHRIAILDIEVETVGGYPNMETFNQPITAIAVYSSVDKKYTCYVLDESGAVKNSETETERVYSFKTEEDLILSFLDAWEKIAPTVASGWNIDGFDFPYLHGRITRVIDEKEANRLSPIGIAYFNKYKKKMTIAGINCLDYLLLYKRYSQKNLPNFRLDSVGIEELNIGKIDYEGSLDDLKRDDVKKFIEYNIHDIRLIVMLDEKLQFINLAMTICHVCHVGYEEFHVSSKFLEGALLTYLYRQKLIAPNKAPHEEREYSSEGDEEEESEKFIGAYVKDPEPGLYPWVCSADINSLYPSTIMTLNVSPETKVVKIDNWDAEKYLRKEIEDVVIHGEKYPLRELEEMLVKNNFSVSANGVIYDQNKKGCIPEILKLWFDQRVEFKNQMKDASSTGDKAGEIFWKRRQQVQKILLNSLYGVVGLRGWRFYDRDNAEAITLTGQAIIKSSAKYVNSVFNKRCGTVDKDYVIYIDTDSVYLDMQSLMKADDISSTSAKTYCIEQITDIGDRLNEFYKILTKKMFNSSLNRIVIAPDVVAKSALWTSKKHYAMLKVYDMELQKDIDKLDVKGLDVVRSSYPKKFREFMSEVLLDLLQGTNKIELDQKILDFKGQMKTFALSDIAKNTSVNFVSKTEEKINFDPKSRASFSFLKGTTAQTKAALAYNDMLKKYDLLDTEPIMSGGKIKWVYLHKNPLGLDGLAFKDDGKDPKIIIDFLQTYVDHDRIWEAELQSKLEDFYKACKWQIFSVDGAKIDEFFSF
jgi:DNA polymerase elongation subunit (family B)